MNEALVFGFLDELEKVAIKGTPLGRAFERRGISEIPRTMASEKLRRLRGTSSKSSAKKELGAMRAAATKGRAKAPGDPHWWLKKK